MKIPHQKEIILFLLGSAGILFLFEIYPQIFPDVFIDQSVSRNEIKSRAKETLEAWGYFPGNYSLHVKFESDADLLRYVNDKMAGNDSLKKSSLKKLPVYYWEATWRKPKKAKKKPPSVEKEKQLQVIPPWVDKIQFGYSQQGREIYFHLTAVDDSTVQSLSETQASEIADSLFHSQVGADTLAFVFSKMMQNTRENRVDYSFQYQGKNKTAGLPVTLKIDVVGDRAGGYEYQYETPEHKPAQSGERLVEISGGVILFILIILIIISGVKKLRADEIDFRVGLPFAIVVASVLAIQYLLSPQLQSNLYYILSLFFGAILPAVVLLLVASTTDSLARETWNDKLLTLDTLRNGRIRYALFGKNLLRGIVSGFILCGILAVLLKFSVTFSQLDLTHWSAKIDDINSHFPLLLRLSKIINITIWAQFVFLLFPASFLVRYTGLQKWLYLAVVIAWAMGFSFIDGLPARPYWLVFLKGAIFGAFLLYLFLRFDFLTTIIAQLTFLLVINAVRMLHFNSQVYLWSGLFLLSIIAGFALLAFAGLGRELSARELTKYSPGHVKRIIERERLKRELEIARRVQLSFLPAKNPSIHGLDVSSVCIPASEVGGDYYDFIRLDDRKLGVAIGDVSGKGISAAFYMTLTKGFLRSLTRSPLSPAQVLTEMNSLFFENVERGHFISMIYGIFDLDAKTFSFARAGHNPIISYRNGSGKSEILCPPGLALGLDGGGLFSQTIEEITVQIEADDLFVFYTDGFSEAMNKHAEEFGEDRLEAFIKMERAQNARDLLLSVEKHVQHFVGASPRHDDMTMVICKVGEEYERDQ
ncbi:MAG: SpoIIE family protein phosphatase [Calditrichaeota bacterium]|nr:SpoIIE family protein phosphatase [Calditrichota bacterium]